MILISHRGNIDGRIESLENKPDYIDFAISKGYDVEIDIWHKDNTIWLGHDSPEYAIDMNWLSERSENLWVHCKNTEAVSYFRECGTELNYFWHQSDDVTLTSKRHIWSYPGKQPICGSIAVMPELFNDDLSECIGICSDLINRYKFYMERTTPDMIGRLADGEIFVFGSNQSGRHGKGAAKTALGWGAIWGQAEGLQGRTYGIPTKDASIRKTLSLGEISAYVERFIDFAKSRPDLTFLVTEIGCGLAGLKPKEVAPLFESAAEVENIHLPEKFWRKIL